MKQMKDTKLNMELLQLLGDNEYYAYRNRKKIYC